MAQQVTDRHLDAAREEALRDADTLADWLGGECYQKPVSKWQPQLMCARLSDLPTCDLLSLAMDAGQKPQTRTHALDLIAERYAATRADEIEAKAALRAGEMAEQEQAEAYAAVDETFGYVRAAA